MSDDLKSLEKCVAPDPLQKYYMTPKWYQTYTFLSILFTQHQAKILS